MLEKWEFIGVSILCWRNVFFFILFSFLLRRVSMSEKKSGEAEKSPLESSNSWGKRGSNLALKVSPRMCLERQAGSGCEAGDGGGTQWASSRRLFF